MERVKGLRRCRFCARSSDGKHSVPCMKRDQVRLWRRIVILLCGLWLGVIRYLVWDSTIWKPHVTVIHVWKTWVRGHDGLLGDVVVW